MAPILSAAPWTAELLMARAQLLVLSMRAWFAACRVPSTVAASIGIRSRGQETALEVVPLTEVMTGLALVGVAFLLASLALSSDVDVAWPMTIAIDEEIPLPEMTTEAVLAVMLTMMLSLPMAVTPPLPSAKASPREVEDGVIELATASEVFGPSITQPAPRETDLIGLADVESEEVVMIAMAVE